MKLKQLIQEEKLTESLGGGISGAFGHLVEYSHTLQSAGYIDGKTRDILSKAVDACETVWKKQLKGKGVSGW